ncbi:hypothetical protein Pla175_29020 [Pirellulimonas nuda]|uniref:PEP-CTERM protein-sorting domain-containing protein n=1 Tax=Pirellulimonas nuda TaxID=2528009 RepID=A0A518DDG4_9BACT|nr:hypothetical protein [Pirellulimonas nuda]QDU89510.1 hypothetical protein Pla175_29020 [Pirellulimonas nuda]
MIFRPYALTLALVALPGLSSAQSVLNIDFGGGPNASGAGNFVGLAAYGADPAGAAALWNGINDPLGDAGTTNPLFDSLNTPTSVSYRHTTAGGGGTFIKIPPAQEVGTGDPPQFLNLMNDYIWFNGGGTGRTATISGLTPNATYDLYAYGQGDTFTSLTSNQASKFTVNGIEKTTTYDTDAGGMLANDGLLAENIEYVRFTAVNSGPSGQIQISHVNPTGGGFSAFNGLQIVGTFLAPPVPLNLEVNTTNGTVTIQNNNQIPVQFDVYVIETSAGTLSKSGWNSLSDQNFDATAGAADGDYNDDGAVDAADYTVWRDSLNLPSAGNLENDPIGGTVGAAQYDQWKNGFGDAGGTATGWDEAFGTSNSLLAEFYLGSGDKPASSIAAGQSLNLGPAFTSASADGTLTFNYYDTQASANMVGTVSFVNAAIGGNTVPEPGCVWLLLAGAVSLGWRLRTPTNGRCG